MNGARTRIGLRSRRRRICQPGCISRPTIAIRLLLRGHSWRFAKDEANKVIE